MHRFAIVLLVMCLAGTAFAADDGAMNVMPPKGISHVGLNPGIPDGREGGETIATAVVIPGLPFIDSGNTCDNINDYDSVCPYTGSTSPDVVYAYTPAVEEIVAIDLCLSGYDTKVYVYDSAMGVVGCNDDFYSAAPCFTYSSFLEVTLYAGQTYYIVVDGYGGDCGDYTIEVTGGPYIPCVITCDPQAVPEGEGPLVPDYLDNYNAGCNATPPVFQLVNWIDMSGCAHIEGVSGWYPYQGSQYRDTDWYQVVAAGTQMTVTIETDNELTFSRCMMTSANPICGSYTYSFQSSVIEACEEMTWTVPTTVGAFYWIFVAPAEWIDGPVEWNYCLEICGHMYDVIDAEDASWGAVKNLYK